MPKGKRPDENPEDSSYLLLECLKDLKETLPDMVNPPEELILLSCRLSTTQARKPTGESISALPIDMYDDFVRISEHGRNCQYARKSHWAFMKFDYEEIRDMLLCISPDSLPTGKIKDLILQSINILKELHG